MKDVNKKSNFSSAYITVPTDSMSLVAALTQRLGGRIVEEESLNFITTGPNLGGQWGGKALRTLRQQAGLTQKELALAIGVPQSHISDFEHERRTVPYKHAKKLEVALGINLGFDLPEQDRARVGGAKIDAAEVHPELALQKSHPAEQKKQDGNSATGSLKVWEL